jgi:hypothetical protein
VPPASQGKKEISVELTKVRFSLAWQAGVGFRAWGVDVPISANAPTLRALRAKLVVATRAMLGEGREISMLIGVRASAAAVEVAEAGVVTGRPVLAREATIGAGSAERTGLPPGERISADAPRRYPGSLPFVPACAAPAGRPGGAYRPQ